MLAISLPTLQQLIASAVDAGIQSYERERNPQSDLVKKSEAKRFIARYGYQPVMIDKWSEAKLLSSHKNSDAQNSARWYSIAEIKQLIASIQLKQACNDSMVYKITKQQ